MELKGKLIRWNQARGFGFIKSDSINKDIFIHISALRKILLDTVVRGKNIAIK